MCGRFALHAHPQVVALQFGLETAPECAARYNIAPGALILAVRAAAHARPQAVRLRWGLVPRWAKDPAIGVRMNNARAETLATKPSFRDTFRRRRCLVPASGFYEWRAEGGRRQPWYVHPARGELFAFAALWERWEGEGGPRETCAIVTTEANAPMQAVHERMPVIVAAADYDRWLDCRADNDVRGLLHPCPGAEIALRRVSRAVNDARNESPQLVAPEEG